MLLYQGIKAAIKSFDDDKPYPEHRRRKAPNARFGGRKEVYIEAVSGERFYIVVEFTYNFNFMDSEDVQIAVTLDDDERIVGCISAEDVKPVHIAWNPERQLVIESAGREIDGRWVNCGMTFAELQIGKSEMVCLSHQRLTCRR